MLKFLGDIHSFYPILIKAAEKTEQDVSAVIQVGDFGWYKDDIKFFDKNTPDIPTYFIDGNHEDHDLLPYKEVTEVAKNLFFVPRGTVLTMEGKRIAFMGGAASVDRKMRLKLKWHWSAGEDITPEEVARFDDVESIDIFVTHTPPTSVIRTHFDPKNLENFGLPWYWVDPNAEIVEKLWVKWGRPLNISGHMHRSVFNHNYRILNEYEDFVLDLTN